MTHKHFIALVLATAISITALAPAPARAGHDTARIIVGVAALALIGAAIAEANNRRDIYVTRNVYNDRWQPPRGRYYRYDTPDPARYRHWRHHREIEQHHRGQW